MPSTDRTNLSKIPEIPFDNAPELLRYLPSAVAVLAQDGSVRAVNRAALTLLDLDISDVIGRHFTYFLHSPNPPLLAGGFPALLEMGGSTFDIALRYGDARYMQIELRLVVFYDDQARQSGVLVMSNEGEEEELLVREAMAKVADRVSRMIAYNPSGDALWPKLFSLCQELFGTPGGWLVLHKPDGSLYTPFVFGPMFEPSDTSAAPVPAYNCSCIEQNTQSRAESDGAEDEPGAANYLDCAWLASLSATSDPSLPFRHHAVAPIVTSTGERVGHLSLLTPADRLFDRQELELMDVITDQIGQVLEREEIYLPVQTGRLERFTPTAITASTDKYNLELLYQLSQSLVATLEPEDVADKALELVTATFNDCYGEIYVVERDEELLQLLASKNYPPEVTRHLPGQPYLRPGVGIEGAAAAMRRPVLVPDVGADPRWIPIPALGLTLHSMAAIPLVARNELVGLLSVSSSEFDAFPSHYLPLLEAITTSVALALQNARLFAAERRKRQEAEMLQKATAALTLDLRLEQILRILLERLQQVVPFDSACVMIREDRALLALAELGLPHPEEVLGRHFPVDNSFFTDIERSGKAIFFSDVQRISGFWGWGGTSTTRGWMGVPLIHRGVVLGYITLDSLEVNAYGENEVLQAQAFANQATITIVNAQLLQESQQAAFEQQEVSAILRGLNNATTLAQISAAVAPGLHRLIDVPAVEIALYQRETRQVLAERSYWTDGASDFNRSISYGFDESAAIAALLQGHSHITTAIDLQTRKPIEKEWAAQGYHFHFARPLRGSGHTLGHIQLLWRDRMEPSQAIHYLLPQVADGVAMAIERLSLFATDHPPGR